jgi:16S rRNA (cytosine1402-N4)-methyltransferase
LADFGHTPVLLSPVLEALNPTHDLLYVDATLGAGGHSEAILKALTADTTQSNLVPALIGVDQDPVALGIAQDRLSTYGNSFQAVEGNFSQLSYVLPSSALPISGGLLVDLGVSSMQLDTAERGFSFSKNAPLDMRMSPKQALTAADIVNTYSESDLRRIFYEYGEERLTAPITLAILRRREEKPFTETQELSQLIYNQYKGRNMVSGGKAGKIHPATRIFQALRIEVNDELNVLKTLLESLPTLLAPGARVAIISFHSLEDRLVKQFFKTASQTCVCPPRFPICQCNTQPTFKLLQNKAITATAQEIAENPRSRSAKLRTAIRV